MTRRRRYRRDPPSLLTVLRLIRQVQHAPEERDVLHDALLERYGDDYEHHIESAIDYAHRYQRPWVVLVRPTQLIDAERGRPLYSWTERKRPSRRGFDPIPFFIKPANPGDFPASFAAARWLPSKGSRRAVVTFVAEPRKARPEGRAYHLQGWERFRR